MERLSYHHLVCLQEEARRHRAIEFPGDAHRPAPFMGEVPGDSEEEIRLRDAVDLVVLADEEGPAPRKRLLSPRSRSDV